MSKKKKETRCKTKLEIKLVHVIKQQWNKNKSKQQETICNIVCVYQQNKKAIRNINSIYKKIIILNVCACALCLCPGLCAAIQCVCRDTK